jgi:hypothetical protein
MAELAGRIGQDRVPTLAEAPTARVGGRLVAKGPALFPRVEPSWSGA